MDWAWTSLTQISPSISFPYVSFEESLDFEPFGTIPHFDNLAFTADGTDFKGERLTVQFARGPRHKDAFSGPPDRSTIPRPRRTIYRMQISGLPETSWQVSLYPIQSLEALGRGFRPTVCLRPLRSYTGRPADRLPTIGFCPMSFHVAICSGC